MDIPDEGWRFIIGYAILAILAGWVGFVALVFATWTAGFETSPSKRAANFKIALLVGIPSLLTLAISKGAIQSHPLLHKLHVPEGIMFFGIAYAAMATGTRFREYFDPGAIRTPSPSDIFLPALLGAAVLGIAFTGYFNATQIKLESLLYVIAFVVFVLFVFGWYLRELERPASPASNLPAPSQIIPVAGPPGPMVLKLRKSQGYSWLGSVIFMIDARMEISPYERSLIEKYKLGDVMIYSSTGRERHREAMKARLENTKRHPVLTLNLWQQFKGLLHTIVGFLMAGAHATMAAYHLKITVKSLGWGVHIRCKDMNEVLVAKGAIVEAAENLRMYLDVAQTFDGSEEILEF